MNSPDRLIQADHVDVEIELVRCREQTLRIAASLVTDLDGEDVSTGCNRLVERHLEGKCRFPFVDREVLAARKLKLQ